MDSTLASQPHNLLQASLLHYAKGIAQAAAPGAAIVDCVMTVPAFWGPAQRQAYIDAARLAGNRHKEKCAQILDNAHDLCTHCGPPSSGDHSSIGH